MQDLIVRILPRAKEYIARLSGKDQGRVAADIDALSKGDFDSIATKLLRTPIHELIVGNHRFTYFVIPPLLWFVSGFLKKSQKTPKKEIQYAQNIHKQVATKIKNEKGSNKKNK